MGYLVAEKDLGVGFDKKIMKINLKKIKKDRITVTRCKGHIFNRAKRKTAKLSVNTNLVN